MNHPFFVIAACYADWTPGGFSKTARKRQIGPNGLLASTARTFSNTSIFVVFCSFRPSGVIGALPVPSLHQNELNASTACTFSQDVVLMIFVKTQPSVVIGAPLPISYKASGLMRATLVGQSGSRNPLLRPRRTTQRTVVIGGRPAPLLPQNGLFTTTACTFSTTCVFTCFCSFPRAVVIRVRPALSFDQYGLLASTACTFLRRLMLIVFGYFSKTCAPLRREAPFGSPGLSP